MTSRQATLLLRELLEAHSEHFQSPDASAERFHNAYLAVAASLLGGHQ